MVLSEVVRQLNLPSIDEVEMLLLAQAEVLAGKAMSHSIAGQRHGSLASR